MPLLDECKTLRGEHEHEQWGGVCASVSVWFQAH